jgi:hypothetical protein
VCVCVCVCVRTCVCVRLFVRVCGEEGRRNAPTHAQELLAATPEGHPDREAVSSSVDLVASAMTQVDVAAKNRESGSKLRMVRAGWRALGLCVRE